jgi:hypothetical protein
VADTLTPDLVSLLRAHRIDLTTEDALQRGIAILLERSGLEHSREVELTKADRIDFLVEGCGVECKIDGSTPSVLRQLHRYAQHESVQELLLVTTRAAHVRALPRTMNDKPVRGLVLYGAFA